MSHSTYYRPRTAVTQTMSNSDADDAAADTDEVAACDVDHVDDLEDGCGCVEVWEHLSERRAATADD